MRRRAVYLMLVLSPLAAACSGGSTPAATSSTTSTSSATSVPTSTTTTLVATTTTLPLHPAGSPIDATRALLAAWKAGDRAAASAVATPPAVESLFAADPGSVQDRGCNQPPPDTPVLCVYRTGAGELQLRASPVPGGWVVDQVLLSVGG
jgi:hypothetical protein